MDTSIEATPYCGIVQAHALFVGKGGISCLTVFATY